MSINFLLLIFFIINVYYKVAEIDNYKQKITHLNILNTKAVLRPQRLTGTQADILFITKEYQLEFLKWEDQAWLFRGNYQNVKNWLLKLTTFSAIQIENFSLERSADNKLILQVVLCYV